MRQCNPPVIDGGSRPNRALKASATWPGGTIGTPGATAAVGGCTADGGGASERSSGGGAAAGGGATRPAAGGAAGGPIGAGGRGGESCSAGVCADSGHGIAHAKTRAIATM